jgi:hypothetical protein
MGLWTREQEERAFQKKTFSAGYKNFFLKKLILGLGISYNKVGGSRPRACVKTKGLASGPVLESADEF